VDNYLARAGQTVQATLLKLNVVYSRLRQEGSGALQAHGSEES
jgi:hypothetical protein